MKYSSPRWADNWFPSITPKECMDGWSTLTLQSNFLGWIVSQIFLPMVLRWRTLRARELRYQKLQAKRMNFRPTRFQKSLFLACNHVTRRPCWWCVGGQYNRIFSHRIYMKVGFSPQRRETLLFLTQHTTNMAAVMSRANQKLQPILIFFKFVYLCPLLCLLSCLYLL